MMMESLFDSPFVVPVAACMAGLGIVMSGMWSGVRRREMQSQERLAAIARGVAIPPTAEEIAAAHPFGVPAGNAERRRDNIRLGGIVLISVGSGLVLFFVVLAVVLQVRPVLCGAAAGLIPLGIGVGLLIDARVQTRALEDARTTASSPGTGLAL